MPPFAKAASEAPAPIVPPKRYDIASANELVTPAKRRREIADERKRLAEVRGADNRNRQAAEDVMRSRIATATRTRREAKALRIVSGPPPPTFLHERHTYIICGGVVGCVKCGGISGFQRSALLAAECRRFTPTGSMGPIQKLAKGRLPHRQRVSQGEWWTSGEEEPEVMCWKPDVKHSAAAGLMPTFRLRVKARVSGPACLYEQAARLDARDQQGEGAS